MNKANMIALTKDVIARKTLFADLQIVWGTLPSPSIKNIVSPTKAGNRYAIIQCKKDNSVILSLD